MTTGSARPKAGVIRPGNLPPSRRRSVRLRGWQYGQPAAYYVTICAHQKRCLFGRVAHRVMRPNEAGRMVVEEWRRLGERFEHVHPADLVVMPNHLHGILRFTSVGEPLGRIVSAFKSITTVAYVRGVRHRDWPTFDSQLWQRNYWERVLRDDDEVAHARAYIRDNPVYWRTDRLHPDHP